MVNQETAAVTTAELVENSDTHTVTVSTKLSPEIAETLWQVTDSGFDSLNGNSLTRQSMTKEEYMADVNDPTTLKFITYEKDTNQPIGLGVVHASLDSVPWVSREYYEQHFQEVVAANRALYVSTIVVEESKRGVYAGQALVNGIANYLYREYGQSEPHGIGFLDYTESNSQILPGFLRHCLGEIGKKGGVQFKYENVGRQDYFMVQPEPSPEVAPRIVAEVLERADIEKLWQGYQKVTKESHVPGPGKTTLTQEEFVGYCLDPTVRKVIFSIEKGISVPLFICDASQIEHLSMDYAKAASGATEVLYMPGIDAFNGEYNTPEFTHALEKARSIVAAQEAAVIFDINNVTEMGSWVAKSLQGSKQKPEPIDSQHYSLITA